VLWLVILFLSGFWTFLPVLIILFGIFYLIYVLRKNKEPETEQSKTEKKDQTGKLFRARKDKIIGGVCGGIAKNLDIDPVIVRVLWVILTLATTIIFGVIVYIIWMIVIPEETYEQQQASATTQAPEKPAKATPKRVKKLPEKKDETEEK